MVLVFIPVPANGLGSVTGYTKTLPTSEPERQHKTSHNLQKLKELCDVLCRLLESRSVTLRDVYERIVCTASFDLTLFPACCYADVMQRDVL